MSNKVNYEWVIEHEDEHGDIIDLDFEDKLSAYREDDFEPIDGCVKATMLLVRDEYTDHEGVLNRTQALPNDDGVLAFGDWRPAGDFDDSIIWCEYPNMKVPKKLQEEYRRFINRKAGQA